MNSQVRVERGRVLPRADIALSGKGFDRIHLARTERALRSLSIEQREVLLLVAVEQLSYAQTAKALAISIKTVMSRLSQARARLQQLAGAANPI